MLLSIIIPIYNTSLHELLRCFDSVHTLQGVEYEALLIDDGSRNKVGDYCRRYVEKNPTFRYFYRDNAGVSAARNFGIGQARGKYLMFLDSDDMMYGQPVTADLLQQGHQLILLDAMIQKGREESWHYAFPKGTQVDREQLLHRLVTSKALNSPWAKLFDRSLLQQYSIRFPEDFVSGEDWMFVAAFAQKAERVCYVPLPGYHYFLDNRSGADRVIRYPDRIIDNQLTRFGVKKQLLEQETWRCHETSQMLASASVELVENLFNTGADLRDRDKLTTPRRDRLKTAAEEAGGYLISPPLKTRLKLLALTKWPWLMGPLSILRSAYLN